MIKFLAIFKKEERKRDFIKWSNLKKIPAIKWWLENNQEFVINILARTELPLVKQTKGVIFLN